MSNNGYEDIADLNEVAMNEFKILVDQSADLVPEWKQTILQLLEGSNIPQNLESLKRLIAGV